MTIRDVFNIGIEEDRTAFNKEITLKNIDRGKMFAFIIILIEMGLFITNLYFSNKPITSRYNFQYASYGFMYMLIIIGSFIYLRLFAWAKKKLKEGQIQYAGIEILMVSYVTFIMIWSAVISLFDQRLYGNVSAYLIALMLGSIIFYFNIRAFTMPYLVSMMIFGLGLPYFQASTPILIGHYVNVVIFAILSWVLGRTLYLYQVKEYYSRWEVDNKNNILKDINHQLSEEVRLREQTQEQLEKANQELEKLTLVDELTGIPNRRNLDNFLEREWNRAIRDQSTISLLMIDIDYFKAFNDNYGHLSGDECLIKVAQALSAHCRRSSDFVARLGGEEFLFAAINMDEDSTWNLAEKIRNSIQDLDITHEYSETAAHLTVSIGINIARPLMNDRPVDSINKADRSLYKAKMAGRNRVEMCC